MRLAVEWTLFGVACVGIAAATFFEWKPGLAIFAVSIVALFVIGGCAHATVP